MIADREFALLQEEVRKLRQRFENMLSRAGGRISGSLTFTGDLKPERSGTQYTGYLFIPLENVATSTNWDGDAKTTSDNGIIDLSVEFGLPGNIRAVAALFQIRDTTINIGVLLKRDSGSLNAIVVRTQVTNQFIDNSGIVPCDENGDIYFATAGNLDSVNILITGYFI